MNIEDPDDAGVGEAAGDPGLVEEPLTRLRVGEQVGQEDLESDILLADAVEGGEDGAHAAGAQEGADLVAVGEHLAGGNPEGGADRPVGMYSAGCHRSAGRQVAPLGQGKGRGRGPGTAVLSDQLAGLAQSGGLLLVDSPQGRGCCIRDPLR